MSAFVTTGAMMTCSFGLTPCPLVVLPARTVMLSGRPKANIMDFAPITNIASFGMCSAPTNPTVIAATAAAMGVFTPMPCIPAIVSPWIPGYPQVLVQGMPALTDDSRNMCMWLGVISFTQNGQIPLPSIPFLPPIGKPNIPVPIRLPLTSADFSTSGGGGGGGGGSDSSNNQDEYSSTKDSSDNGRSNSSQDSSNTENGNSGSLEQQYKSDIKKAEAAGKQQEMMSKSFEKVAKESVQAGNVEKAVQAQKMAETALANATNKKNEAVGDVNQFYRETMPPSKKQMDRLTPAQQKKYLQQRDDINQQREQTCRQAEATYEAGAKDQLAATTRDLKMHYASKREQTALKQLSSDTFKATLFKEQ